MNQQESWKLFETTGSIGAYLLYACASEEKQLGEEVEKADGPGNYDRDGSFVGACRGI